MSEVPVERRVYFPPSVPDRATSRPCPVCGRHEMTPWFLRRDLARRVFRRWVCAACQHEEDLIEDGPS